MSKKNILVIYTGGTIGMTEQFEGGPLIPFDFQNIIDHLPELKRITNSIDIAPFPHPYDSSDIQANVWGEIAKLIQQHYQEYDGFVVLHGTDTMAYTASALSFMLQDLDKPVIFTGSQLPIGKIRTDGKENLITAIEIACASNGEKAMVQEVAICFGAHLLRGNRTTKFSAEGFEAFQSPNFPPLAEIGVHIQYREELLLRPKNTFACFTEFHRNVAVIKIHPNLNRSFFEAIVDHALVDGIILETYGSGTIPQQSWLLEGIKKWISQEKIIINISQCPQGIIDQALYKNAQSLQEIGVLSGRDMTTEAAIAKLMFVMGHIHDDPSRIQQIESAICGEMNEHSGPIIQ